MLLTYLLNIVINYIKIAKLFEVKVNDIFELEKGD